MTRKIRPSHCLQSSGPTQVDIGVSGLARVSSHRVSRVRVCNVSGRISTGIVHSGTTIAVYSQDMLIAIVEFSFWGGGR